jgi:hypothetical protein
LFITKKPEHPIEHLKKVILGFFLSGSCRSIEIKDKGDENKKKMSKVLFVLGY